MKNACQGSLEKLPLEKLGRPTAERNPEIDRLRAVAILMTVYCHLSALFPWPIRYPYLLSDTGTGVHLFFVISGYVVCRSLVPQLEAALSGQEGLPVGGVVRRFFRRRFYRLLPVSWFWLGYILIGLLYFYQSGAFIPRNVVWREALAVVALIYNVFTLFGGSSRLNWHWSLSVEEQFYALLPIFVITAGLDRSRVRWLVLGAGLIYVAARIADHGLLPGRGNLVLLAVFQIPFLCIITGCAIYEWSVSAAYPGRIANWLVKPVLGSVFCGIFLGLLAIEHDALKGYPAVLQYLASSLLGGALVLQASLSRGVILGFKPTRRLLDWIGTRSYTIYLVHIPAFWTTRELWFRMLGHEPRPEDWVLMAMMALGIGVVLTELSYRWIEQPMIRRGRGNSIGLRAPRTQPSFSKAPIPLATSQTTGEIQK